MRVSMVMIARDEQANVRPCLESFWDHVDDIVFVDTGSTDDTVEAASLFGEERGERDKMTIGYFEWRDDFAAARAHAHSLARGDVHGRIDLDDRIIGGEHLRAVALNFERDPHLAIVNALWSGPMTPAQWRGQIFRADHEWRGPTYEYPHFDQGTVGATSLIRWHHTRSTPRGRRDLDIALAWALEEPTNSRPLNAAAEEAFILGVYDLCDACCAKALELDIGLGLRSYFLQLQARARLELGDATRARKLARAALKAIDAAGDTGTDFLGVRTKAWTVMVLAEMHIRDREVLRCARKAMETATTEEGRQAVIQLVKRENKPPRLDRTAKPPALAAAAGSVTRPAAVHWAAR